MDEDGWTNGGSASPGREEMPPSPDNKAVENMITENGVKRKVIDRYGFMTEALRARGSGDLNSRKDLGDVLMMRSAMWGCSDLNSYLVRLLYLYHTEDFLPLLNTELLGHPSSLLAELNHPKKAEQGLVTMMEGLLQPQMGQGRHVKYFEMLGAGKT